MHPFNIFLLSTALLLVFASPAVQAASHAQEAKVAEGCAPCCFQDPATWNQPAVCKALSKGKVVTIVLMKKHLKAQGKKVDFGGEVYLVTLANHLKAVFKPFVLEDEQPNQEAGQAALAAYQAACLLGFPAVPPMVMRTIMLAGKPVQGTLQLYVHTPVDLLAGEHYAKALAQADPDEVANLKLFYFVFGQFDTGPHNLLVQKKGNKHTLVAIDNDGIRNRQHVRYGELPFVGIAYSDKFETNDWGKPFPFEACHDIAITPAALLKAFPGQGHAFYTRFKYGKKLRYVLYQNRLWRQFHAFDDNFVKSFTRFCPQETLKKLKKLTLEDLHRFFAVAIQGKATFVTKAYFQAILERRDQVVAYFEQKGSRP